MGPCVSAQSKKSSSESKASEKSNQAAVIENKPKKESTAQNNEKNNNNYDDDNLLEIGVINYEEWLQKREAIKERQKTSKPEELGQKNEEEKIEEKGLFKRITDVEDNQNAKQEDPNYLLENMQKLTVINKTQVANFLKDVESHKGKILSASFLLRFFFC